MPRLREKDLRNNVPLWLFTCIVGMLNTIILNSYIIATTALVPVVTQSSLSQRIHNSAISQNKNCIVVGGGPIGLAVAYTLARSPHYYNVTILESSTTVSSNYNPSMSYLYNINAKGLDWFMDPSIAPKLAYENLLRIGYSPGIDTFGQFFVIPSDPRMSIPNAKQATVAVSSSKQNKVTSAGSVQNRRPSYWIQRHQMLELLYQCCQEHNQNEGITKIHILSGKTVYNLYPSVDDMNLISAQCNDGSIYTGSLIVAADGKNSIIRSRLAGLLVDKKTAQSSSSLSWLQSQPLSFRLRKYKTPSTGLKLKAIQFKPNFTIPNGTITDENNCTINQYFTPLSTDIVSVRGTNNGLRNRIFIGLFPINDPTMIRPGSTITPYNHEIWSFQNGSEARMWFTKTFPRLWTNNNDTNSVLINDDVEWERFVQANGTTFPFCQYSPGSAISSPNGLCGVVMVGDACKFILLLKMIYYVPLV
jgi:NAD(P)-binding Rossmann-like domain